MSFNEKNKVLARKHVADLRNILYKEWIKDSIDKSVIYTDTDCLKVDYESNPVVQVKEIDVVSAVFEYADRNTAVLNFADYLEPGGGFMKGGEAQEESLCHASTLYPVLAAHQEDYYDVNAQDVNGHLYTNKALYSPDILFIRERRKQKVDIITCAAPNLNRAQKSEKFNITDNTNAMLSRIQFIMDVAGDNSIDTLILGAWGCGVFGQDVLEVARMFKYVISTKCTVKNIIFAIRGSKTYNIFKNVFDNEEAMSITSAIVSYIEKSSSSGIIRVGDDVESPRLIFGHNGVISDGELCTIISVHSDDLYDLRSKNGVEAYKVRL